MTDFNNPLFTHPCSEVTEDHARHVILHQYTGCIVVENTWAIPLNSTQVRLSIPAVIDMMVGCCIWNPAYGYFRVVAFDKLAQRIDVVRKQHQQTRDPGVTVPGCTKFIIVADIV